MPKLKKKTRQMQPSRMLVLGFSIIILAGATLLFLPISSKSGQFSSFIDCLFTATSATCVTGITVLDTFNYFNGFGQGVILALIQVGGLGFLTLVTFINLILGKKLGWSTVKIAASDLTDNALETTPKRLFYEIVLTRLPSNLSALSYLRLSLFPTSAHSEFSKRYSCPFPLSATQALTCSQQHPELWDSANIQITL